MHYSKINLDSKLFRLDPENLCINKTEIQSIRLHRRYGRGDKLLLNKSTLEIITEGYRSFKVFFEIDSKGNIKESNPDFFIDKQIAKEELIILKTNDYRTVYE